MVYASFYNHQEDNITLTIQNLIKRAGREQLFCNYTSSSNRNIKQKLVQHYHQTIAVYTVSF